MSKENTSHAEYLSLIRLINEKDKRISRLEEIEARIAVEDTDLNPKHLWLTPSEEKRCAIIGIINYQADIADYEKLLYSIYGVGEEDY